MVEAVPEPYDLEPLARVRDEQHETHHQSKRGQEEKNTDLSSPDGVGNYRFDGTGEQQSASAVVPNKSNGDQENEPAATSTTQSRNAALQRRGRETSDAPSLSRRLLRTGGLRGASLTGADPTGAPGLVQAQDGRGNKNGAVGAGADADEEGEGEVAQGRFAEDE